ncbi:hypothetical protein [Streptodolium elevatio]
MTTRSPCAPITDTFAAPVGNRVDIVQAAVFSAGSTATRLSS